MSLLIFPLRCVEWDAELEDDDDDDDGGGVCRGGWMYVAGILFLSGLWSGGVFYLPCAINVK